MDRASLRRNIDAMALCWKDIRHRIEWLALKTVASVVPILGRDALPLLAHTLGSAAYLLDGKSRATALENLRVVFGDQHSKNELRKIARRSFISFAQVQLDNLWTPRLHADNYLEFVDIEFESPDFEAIARQRGSIWVTPHFGNFEWLSVIFGLRGFSFKVVAQSFKNPHLDPVITSKREHTGHQIIPQSGAMLKLLRHIKSGGHAAFLIDLSLAPNRSATVITCMDHLLCTTKLHAELASRTGLPLMPAISIPRPGGGYTMKMFRPLTDLHGRDPREIAQECWNVIEPSLLADPAPWLWPYKHWRYLPEENLRGTTPYPDYANPNKNFDKLALELFATAPD